MIDQGNRLFRLSGSRFAAMLSDPSAHAIPQFATQRVRGAEAVVEQSDRRPVTVIRMVYFMLTFSEGGSSTRTHLCALEPLDWLVEPRGRRLIPNPEHTHGEWPMNFELVSVLAKIADGSRGMRSTRPS